ncbi:MAG TPA: SLC13 family permease, partial [Gemmatimonadales bacterium]|nr:SLC13 family permease [Gemmatimonadales bacterium]
MAAEVAERPDSAAVAALLGLDQFKLSSRMRPATSAADRWMRRIGLPLGVVVFAVIMLLPRSPDLPPAGQAAFAAFALALVWWVTEPIPTYLTSLVLMLLLVATRAWDTTHVLSVLGLDVIWLNVLAFVLSAMLVKTHLAKRLALALILRFGKRASWALAAFVLLQLVLAPLIPATAARAALT